MGQKLIQTTRVYAEIDKAVKAGFTLISLQGSSRSSKTYNTLIWLIVYCLSNPGTRLSIVRATRPAIVGSVFVDFKEILLRMGIFNEKSLNKSELVYTFGNGSWIEFFSCDSEQKLRGRKRDVLFVNEANELSYIEWQQLKMRTTRFAIIDYNPSFTDEHWICSVNADDRTYHFISTYKDNPFLEQSIIDEIESLQHKNKSLWQVYGLGLQAIVEGLVFEHIYECESIPKTARKNTLVADWGYANDPTAIAEIAESYDGEDLYVDEWCYQTGMLTADIVRVLKTDKRGLMLISESADPRLVQEIYRAGINIHPVHKFAGSIDAGLLAMHGYRRIYITKRSINAKKEFKTYTYQQDKEGKWLNKPIDANNHIIDAVRYGVLERYRKYQRGTRIIDDSILY